MSTLERLTAALRDRYRIERVREQQLDRDCPIECDLRRLVNDAHPSAAQLLDDLVLSDPLADHVETPLSVNRARGSERA